MYNFAYQRPDTLRAAAKALAADPDAKILAGGHTLIPTLKQRLASPSALVDLGAVSELRGIERRGRALAIGAMTTHGEIATAPEVADAIPALAYLAGNVGDPAVRHRGTIGGSIANNDPAACYPSALLALDGVVMTNKRRIGADSYFQGLFTTALEEGEIVTRIVLPVPQRAGYAKFANPASRYAIVGVFVAKRAGRVRVAVTGAGSNGVFRWTAAEEALGARFAPASLDGLAMPTDEMNGDIHASPEYRAHLVAVMTKRAVAKALGRRL